MPDLGFKQRPSVTDTEVYIVYQTLNRVEIGQIRFNRKDNQYIFAPDNYVLLTQNYLDELFQFIDKQNKKPIVPSDQVHLFSDRP